MLRTMCRLLGIAAISLSFPLSSATAGDKDALVDNPMYKAWANFKTGSLVTVVEKTTFGADQKSTLPDGVDEKTITYKLMNVSPEKVIVQTVVVERLFLGTVESAPTKTTYLAKIKKSHLQAVLQEFEAKAGEEMLKVLDKEINCKTLTGSQKKDDALVEYKLWHTDTVPGGIVKRVRTTRQDGKLVAETDITLKAFKVAN